MEILNAERFDIEEVQRSKLGIVQRVSARKSTDDSG